MKIASYQDLEVWKKAIDLVIYCYGLTKTFPKHELYGLASQLQRAAVSIPENIAERHSQQHIKEFIQHVSIARGSKAEFETHLIIANRLNYIGRNELKFTIDQTIAIGRMLNGLKSSLEKL